MLCTSAPGAMYGEVADSPWASAAAFANPFFMYPWYVGPPSFGKLTASKCFLGSRVSMLLRTMSSGRIEAILSDRSTQATASSCQDELSVYSSPRIGTETRSVPLAASKYSSPARSDGAMFFDISGGAVRGER